MKLRRLKLLRSRPVRIPAQPVVAHLERRRVGVIERADFQLRRAPGCTRRTRPADTSGSPIAGAATTRRSSATRRSCPAMRTRLPARRTTIASARTVGFFFATPASAAPIDGSAFSASCPTMSTRRGRCQRGGDRLGRARHAPASRRSSARCISRDRPPPLSPIFPPAAKRRSWPCSRRLARWADRLPQKPRPFVRGRWRGG